MSRRSSTERARRWSDLGYRVVEARDASEALRKIDRGERVDLLFADVVLGSGMNGRELAGKVSEELGGLPVLFTTGYTRNAIVHHGGLDPDVELLDRRAAASAPG